MSLDSYHYIESLPPYHKVERQHGPVGKIERFKDNAAPSGFPLPFAVPTPLKPWFKMWLRFHPINKERSYHRWVDISTGGKKCLATSAGIIVEIWRKSGSAGNYIVINHGNGFVTRYMHLGSINSKIKLGAEVRNRQEIGVTWSTGWVTAAHLHYEVIHLDYTVPHISSASLSADKWIDPEITFVKWRQDNTNSVPTLAWTRKNIKTGKSDKTNLKQVNEYLLSQLYAVEDEENIIDAGDLKIVEEETIEAVEPRKIIYRVDDIVANTTIEFRSNPNPSQLVSLLRLYRSSLEFDLWWYSPNEQAWITNHLAKLANYIIKTAREFKTPEEYIAFTQPLLDLYAIKYNATNYHQDLTMILDLCSLVRWSNWWWGRDVSSELSSLKQSVDTKDIKKSSINSELRTKVDKIFQSRTKNDPIERLWLDNYKQIPSIIGDFKTYESYLLDQRYQWEDVARARKYYLLSCEAAHKIMQEFYYPLTGEALEKSQQRRQNLYQYKYKDFATEMLKLDNKKISIPPNFKNDMPWRPSIILSNNETIAKLEKITNK